jgi:hypothetical protein
MAAKPTSQSESKTVVGSSGQAQKQSILPEPSDKLKHDELEASALDTMQKATAITPEPEVIVEVEAIPVKAPTPTITQSGPPPGVRSTCGNCGSTAIGVAGGMRHCNQCGNSWA